MGASKSSEVLPSSNVRSRGDLATRSERRLSWVGILVVFLLLACLSAAAAAWFHAQGWTLYYGDAEAHLNIARRVVDSRTPGYEQLGTAWLPLPHVLMLPFVRNDAWWRSGVAGVFPAAGCFVLAGTFLFAALRRMFDSSTAAAAGVCLFAVNPNLLYLQSTPMTEPIFFAALMGLLWATVWFAENPSVWPVIMAAIFSAAASLSRYEGWFLIPFATLYFLIAARKNRLLYALLFGLIASLAPLYWLAHNWWYYGNALEFYNGPYSARAIYERSLQAGMAHYPGDHDWPKAWAYFRAAAELCAGTPLAWLGAVGIGAVFLKRAFWPVLLLLSVPVFYIWSLHSSGTPIYVPQLWPNSYYNTRYGLAALPLLALGGSALVAIIPRRFSVLAAVLAVGTALSPWIFYPRAAAWVCWKESEVNSEARREWIHQAADFLRANYRPGQGIAISFGDLTGVLREAQIPLREVLHDGNHPQWERVMARPDLFLHEEWAVAFSDDPVSRAILKVQKHGPRYQCVRLIVVKGSQAIEIYRQN